MDANKQAKEISEVRGRKEIWSHVNGIRMINNFQTCKLIFIRRKKKSIKLDIIFK